MVKDYTFYTPILNKVCNYLFGQKIINYFYVSHQLLINTFNITSKTILYVKICDLVQYFGQRKLFLEVMKLFNQYFCCKD